MYLLRGKILNTQEINVYEAVNPKSPRFNKEVSDIVAILGCGVNGQFDLSKCKYKRVVILSDADVDGKLDNVSISKRSEGRQ